jgi:hypothetical protein
MSAAAVTAARDARPPASPAALAAAPPRPARSLPAGAIPAAAFIRSAAAATAALATVALPPSLLGGGAPAPLALLRGARAPRAATPPPPLAGTNGRSHSPQC